MRKNSPEVKNQPSDVPTSPSSPAPVDHVRPTESPVRTTPETVANVLSPERLLIIPQRGAIDHRMCSVGAHLRLSFGNPKDVSRNGGPCKRKRKGTNPENWVHGSTRN